MICSSPICVARVYTRFCPNFLFGWDDWVICISFALIFADWVVSLDSVRWGIGRSPKTISLTNANHMGYLATASKVLWAWAVATIKISVACMLIRLLRDKSW
ncbi:hypothetical protein AOQ84DRAFT_52097 [Glonium stellatum]|uniref:Rhodopsin domain-containing protein n=1 Tax=Glonium stellatum TaxID=574774 RepID=A0A8E2JST3_9PEZI|nr:hypothetical protein AOQ84DRAFT_52097 [Glonium stellatum]